MKIKPLFIFLFLFLFMAVSARAKDSPALAIKIKAQISPDLKRISGNVKFKINNDTKIKISEIPILLWANHFKKLEPDLPDYYKKWIYPKGASFSSTEIKKVSITGYKGKPEVYDNGILAKIPLEKPLIPGATIELSIDFVTHIPVRRGRFGRWKGVVSLGGDWYPRPLEDLTGKNKSFFPYEMHFDLKLLLPPGLGAVTKNDYYLPQDTKQIVQDKIQSQSLALVVMNAMDVKTQKHENVEFVFISRDSIKRQSKWDKTRTKHGELPRGLKNFGEVDAVKRAAWVSKNTLSLIKKHIPEAKIPPKIIMAFIPAWDHLVQQGPGIVFLSDRLWKIIPIDSGLFFHDLEMVSQIISHIALFNFTNSNFSKYANMKARFAGEVFKSIYAKEIHKKRRKVSEILKKASFLPTVDNLIYAPKIPFPETYSISILDDPFQDEPWKFLNTLPDGKLIKMKIEDLIGEKNTLKLVFSMFDNQAWPIDKLLARYSREDMGWFFDQWSGDYPLVNYKLVDVKSKILPDGRYSHNATVVRDGKNIKEPVTVRFIDKSNKKHDITWDGIGKSKTLYWKSGAKIERVIVDPDLRLRESALASGTNKHPKYDNYSSLPMRPPLMTSLLIWVDPIAGEPYVMLGMALRKLYDITNTINLSGTYTPRSIGGKLGYFYHFGKKKTLNSKTWAAGTSAGFHKYNMLQSDFGGIGENMKQGASMASFYFFLGGSTIDFFYDPTYGSSFYVNFRYSLGQSTDNRFIQEANVNIRFFTLFSPAIHHTFALYAGALANIGNPVAANLPTLSDRMILRSFEPDETYGRLGFYAGAEYRHKLIDMSQGEFPISVWLDRLQGALFAGAGTISMPDGWNRLFTRDRLFFEAGYGLRFHTLIGGGQPYVVSVDLAFPLKLEERRKFITSDDVTVSTKKLAPYRIIIGITQTF